MTDLAALVSGAALPEDLPLAVATCDAAGNVETHVQGRWPDGAAVVADDRFYGASLAKQLTGATIAVLSKHGAIDPGAPIATYVTDLPTWAQRVTVRHLLHHTGGLPPAGEIEAPHAGADWTDSLVMEALRALPSVVPGRGFEYSNAGYVLLARAVESAAGLPFAEAVATMLLAPLGLDGMSIESDPARFPQAALMGPALPRSSGDGGLWTSAGAFARWLDAQNRDLVFGIADLVQSPGARRAGFGSNYGWGVGIRAFRGKPIFVHGGSWRGATAKAARCPELGLGAVVLLAGDDQSVANTLLERAVTMLAEGA